MSVKVFSFVRTESSAEFDKYRVRLGQGDAEHDVNVTIFKGQVRVMRRGELETAIGKPLAALVCQQLSNYVDGDQVDFPFTVEDGSRDGQ